MEIHSSDAGGDTDRDSDNPRSRELHVRPLPPPSPVGREPEGDRKHNSTQRRRGAEVIPEHGTHGIDEKLRFFSVFCVRKRKNSVSLRLSVLKEKKKRIYPIYLNLCLRLMLRK